MGVRAHVCMNPSSFLILHVLWYIRSDIFVYIGQNRLSIENCTTGQNRLSIENCTNGVAFDFVATMIHVIW